jgi:hypothetical protein
MACLLVTEKIIIASFDHLRNYFVNYHKLLNSPTDRKCFRIILHGPVGEISTQLLVSSADHVTKKWVLKQKRA